MRSWSPTRAAGLAGVALLLLLAAAESSNSQHTTPFDRLAGQWSGRGTIELANGTHEAIKCRATYDVLEQQKNLQLNIRCASESYSFDLRASAVYSAGTVTGSWTESTRNAAGTISGKASAERFQVNAKSPSFSANLTVTTHGDHQSVVIQPEEPPTSVKRVALTLKRDS